MLFELWLLSRSANAYLADTLATCDMSTDEYGIYSVLAAQRRMSPTALAGWMSAPATTVSSHIKRLEARGHLARQPDPNDGRASMLALTTAGTSAFEQASARYLPMLRLVESRLGTSEPNIRRALAKLRAALDALESNDPASPT